MLHWKRLLLHGYFGATYPCAAAASRIWPARVVRRSWCCSIIASPTMPATPWTAPFSTFERQMGWLERHFDMVSLAEAQHRMRTGNERPSATITFDDGYAENCDRALPLLIERQIPCTYFVCSQHVLSGTPFSHDLALGQRLAPNSPEQLRALARAGIDIGAHTRTHVDLGRTNDPEVLHDEIVVARRNLRRSAAPRCATSLFRSVSSGI